MVLYGEELTDGFVPDKSQQSENSKSGSHVSENIPNDEIFVLQSDEKQNPPSRVPDEAPPKSESAVNGPPLNQEGQCSSLIVLPEKALETPKTLVMPLAPVSKRSNPSLTPEKVSDDGYNWRKYGQKIVKGDYVRSYYRCTYSNCPVKKQLERANDGQIADIVYFGEHDHPKPQRNIPVAVGFVGSIVDERRDKPLLSTVEDVSVDKQNQRPIEADTVVTPQISNVVSDSCSKVALVQSNHIRDEVCDHHDPDSKRQKKDRGNLDTTSWDKPTMEPRFVVQIPSEVDIVNDGYRWRKYGQKLVKGNPNPRSYYRCTNPGCPVKKHVERACYDSKVVITTYEGQHVHDMPPTRTVTHNTAGTSMFTTAHYDSSSTKSEGNAVSHDLVAHDMPDHENKSNEQLNGVSKATSGMVDIAGSDMVSESRSCPESKPNEQQKGKLDEEKTDPIDIEIHHSAGLEGELKDDLNGDSRNTSEANNVCLDAVVHDNLGPERSISELQKSKAEPIQS